MLSVLTAKFYKKADQSGFNGEYSRLKFKKFPAKSDKINLAVEFHAKGEIDGLISFRILRGEDVIYNTGPSHLKIENVGAGKNIGFVNGLDGVEFPAPGNHNVEIIFNNSLLKSVPLLVAKS